jgi:hypothetical protein
MAAVKEHIVLSHPDKQILARSRLLVETMKDVTCHVPLSDMGGCPGVAGPGVQRGQLFYDKKVKQAISTI